MKQKKEFKLINSSNLNLPRKYSPQNNKIKNIFVCISKRKVKAINIDNETLRIINQLNHRIIPLSIQNSIQFNLKTMGNQIFKILIKSQLRTFNSCKIIQGQFQLNKKKFHLLLIIKQKSFKIKYKLCQLED